jgi:predicted dehydrogenase
MDTRQNASWPHLDCIWQPDDSRDRHKGEPGWRAEVSVSQESMRIGVAGLGYWGPNLARNFSAVPGCELSWCCDADPQATERISRQFPGARISNDLEELLADPDLDAVALATPVPSHAELSARVLGAGKHCFVEKPLGRSVAEAQGAVEAAREAGKLLMVGHLLEYHPAVRRLKELTQSGELGERIYYIYGNRVNLGKLRADENALWSLGAHDVSVVLYLAEEEPVEVVAHGAGYVRERVEDVVFCFLRFPSGLRAHLHLSWLDPHKERRFTVVGSRRMATFDDMSLEGKLTVYDKGFDQDSSNYGEYITRSGGMVSPALPNVEPLRLECEHFVHCVRSGEQPQSSGESALRVVRVLEALQRSLEGFRVDSRGAGREGARDGAGEDAAEGAGEDAAEDAGAR